MSQLFANTTTVTRAPAYPDRERADAGAFIDPSGILAVERLRRAAAEEERNGRR